jgi:hypothetical protein
MKQGEGGLLLRQPTNQIKHLGAFFVSTIKSTIKQDWATFPDQWLDSTGSLPASTTNRPDLWGLVCLRLNEKIDCIVQTPGGVGPSELVPWSDGAANNLKLF